MRDPNIDYYTLLRKYIQHVGGCEGCTFIRYDKDEGGIEFNQQEWDELNKLDTEIWDDHNES